MSSNAQQQDPVAKVNSKGGDSELNGKSDRGNSQERMDSSQKPTSKSSPTEKLDTQPTPKPDTVDEGGKPKTSRTDKSKKTGKSGHTTKNGEEDESEESSSSNSSEETHQSYHFNPRRRLRTDSEEKHLNENIQVKQMNFAQHEFVKMNEVGHLISDAINGVLDKLQQKEKMLQAQKMLIRNLESKSKFLQTEINTLMKSTKQIPDVHKRIKEIYGIIEENHNEVKNNKEQQGLENQCFEEIFGNIKTELDVHRSDIKLQMNRCNDLTAAQYALEKSVKINCANNQESASKQISELFDSFSDIPNIVREMNEKFDTTKADLNQALEDKLDEGLQTLRLDQSEFRQMQLSVTAMKEYPNRMDTIQSSMMQINNDYKNLKNVETFVERHLPMMTHFQISEAMSHMVVCERQETALKEFEKNKLEELCTFVKESSKKQPTIDRLSKRLQGFATYCIQNTEQRVPPFTFGKKADWTGGSGGDYWSQMTEDDIVKIFKVKHVQAAGERETNQQNDNEQSLKELSFDIAKDHYTEMFAIAERERLIREEKAKKEADMARKMEQANKQKMGSSSGMDSKKGAPDRMGSMMGSKLASRVNDKASNISRSTTRQPAKKESQADSQRATSIEDKQRETIESHRSRETHDSSPQRLPTQQATKTVGFVPKVQPTVSTTTVVTQAPVQNQKILYRCMPKKENKKQQQALQRTVEKYQRLAMEQFTTLHDQIKSMQDENELDTDHFACRFTNLQKFIYTIKNYIIEKEKKDLSWEKTFKKLEIANKEIANGYGKKLNQFEHTFLNANSTFSTTDHPEGAIRILDQSKEPSRLPTPGSIGHGSPSLNSTQENKDKKWYANNKGQMGTTSNSSGSRNNDVPHINTQGVDAHTSRDQQESQRLNIRTSRREKLQQSQRSLYSARQHAGADHGHAQLMMNSMQAPSLDKSEVIAIVQEEIFDIKTLVENNKETIEANAEKIEATMEFLETQKQNLEEQSTALKDQIEQEVNDMQIFTSNKIEGVLEEVKNDLESTKTEVNALVSKVADSIESNDKRVAEYNEIVITLRDQFDSDYIEFIRDKKRWKSDFDQAASKANTNFKAIEEIVKNCLIEQQTCLKVLKMINDAQMISQLCERQDLEDRKQIGVFGMRNKRQQLNKAFLPEHNANGNIPGKQTLQQAVDTTLAQSLNISMRQLQGEDDEAMHTLGTGNHEEDSTVIVDSPTKASINASNAFLPPGYMNKYDAMNTLKVDPSCLSCSQGPSTILQQLKLACLSYQSSPITYRSQKYQQSELLRVKAEVISDCQKALREHIYKTKGRDGVEMRGLKDENSYVIEPLLYAKPVVATNVPVLESYRSQMQGSNGALGGQVISNKFEQGTGTDLNFLQRSMPPGIIRRVSPGAQQIPFTQLEMDNFSMSHSKKNRNEQINAYHMHQTIDYARGVGNYSTIDNNMKDASQAQLTNFTNRKRSPLPSEISRKNASMMARQELRPDVRAHLAMQGKKQNYDQTQWSSELAPSVNTSAHKQQRRNVFNNQRPSTQAHVGVLGPVHGAGIGVGVPKLGDLGVGSARAKNGIVFNSQNNKHAIFGEGVNNQNGNILGINGVQEEFREPTSSVLSNTAEGPRNEKMKPILYIGGKNITGMQ